MKTLPKLSEASEQRISSALSKVAELIEDGETPTDAITKIASQEQLPAGQVRLMVRAFNTGRSLEHLRAHDTLEEKAASFELADASEILEQLYPSKIKTAAEIHRETVVSDDYSKSSDGWLTRYNKSNKAVSMTKAAAAKVTPYPTLPSKRPFSEINELRKQAEAVRLDANRCAYAVVQTMDKVAEYFRNTTAEPLPIVTENAAAVYGRRVHRLMEKVSTDKTVSKMWKHQDRYKNAIGPVDWTREPYNLVKAALDAVDQFAAAQENLNDAEVVHSEKRAEVLRPFRGDLPIKPIYGSAWTLGSEKQALGGFARDVGAMSLANAVAEFATKRMGTESDKNEMMQDSMNELADPAHEDKLRAIRQQALVHELMAGDPVISGYNYNDVIQAHNHLSEVAPKAMQNRVMAQTMLRKYLEQGQNMDMFDSTQLLEANNKLNDRDMPETMKGYMTGSMRSMGDPMPSRNQAVAPDDAAKTLGQTVFGRNPIPGKSQEWLTPSPAKPSPSKPSKPSPDKDKDKDKENA
jgi:hypothetical protein